MSSKSEKGNISPFLLLIAFIVIILLLYAFAKLMIFKPITGQKYKNPVVASKVIPGKIYDSEGKTLLFYVPKYSIYLDINRINSNQTEKAVEIISSFLNISASEIKETLASSSNSNILIGTVTDDFQENAFIDELEKNNIQNGIYVEKTYIKNYPYGFHAKQLLTEIAQKYTQSLFPNPGLNTDTTNGSDIHLTLDIDMQYILDLSCERLFNVIKPEYLVANLIRAKDNTVIATTTYPYSYNRSLISEFKGKNTFINEDSTAIKDSSLTYDIPETLQIMKNPQTGNVIAIPSGNNPEYYLILGVKSSEILSVTAFEQVAKEVEAGLKSQSKLKRN